MRVRINKSGRHVGYHTAKVNQSGKLHTIPQIGNQIKNVGVIRMPKVPKIKKLKL